MTHPDMSGISTKEAFQKQLENVEALYKEATGKEMTKFYSFFWAAFATVLWNFMEKS